MKKIHMIAALLAMLPTMLLATSGVAYNYARLTTAVSTSSSGRGMVYAGDSTTAGTFSSTESSVQQGGSGSANKNKSFTFYAFAQANEGYEFEGWATTDGGDIVSGSNVLPYWSTTITTPNVADPGLMKSDVTTYTDKKYYAKFKKAVLPAFGITFVTSDAGTYTVDGVAPANKTGLEEATSVVLKSTDENFLNWKVNGTVINDNPYTATCLVDTTISADFLTADIVTTVTTLADLTSALANNSPYRKIIIPSGISITVTKGSTVTVPTDKRLVVDGALGVEGSLTVNGDVIGNGNLVNRTQYIDQSESVVIPQALVSMSSRLSSSKDNNPYGGKTYFKTRKGDLTTGTITKSGTITCNQPYMRVSVNNGLSYDFLSYDKTSAPQAILCSIDTTKGVNYIKKFEKLYSSFNDYASDSDKNGKMVVLLANASTSTLITKFWIDGANAYTVQLKNSNSTGVDDSFIINANSVTITKNTSVRASFINTQTVTISTLNPCSKSGDPYSVNYHLYDVGSFKINSFDSNGNANLVNSSSKIVGGYWFWSGYFDSVSIPSKNSNLIDGGPFDYNCYVLGGSFKSNLDLTQNVLDKVDSKLKTIADPDNAQYKKVVLGEEDGAVAMIGDARYPSLLAAIEAARTGDTVKLIGDTTLNTPITIQETMPEITLNLNGKIIVAPNGAFVNRGTLYLETYGNGGTISSSSYIVENHGTLEITFGTYTGNFSVKENSSLVIHNGTFSGSFIADEGVDATQHVTIRGGQFSKSVTQYLNQDDGQIQKNGYVCIPPYAIVDPSSKSGYYKAWRVHLIEDELLRVYKIGSADDRGRFTNKEDWYKRAELASVLSVYSRTCDAVLYSDKAITQGDVSVYVDATSLIRTDRTLDSDLARFEAYRVLIPLQQELSPTTTLRYYAVLLDEAHDGYVDIALKDNNIANAGVVCDLQMQGVETTSAGEVYEVLHVFGRCRTMLGNKKAAIDRTVDGVETRRAYDTLAQAVADAKDGETVLVGADSSDTITISEEKTIIIDPYGFNFTGRIEAGNGFYIASEETIPKTYKSVNKWNKADFLLETKAVKYTIAAGSAATPVDAPTTVSGLVYDGTEKIGVAAGTGYTLSGNTATAAGSYTATATLEEGYVWSDDSTDAKTIEWSIGKAALTATAENKTVIRGETVEYTIAYSGFVNGEDTTALTSAPTASCTYNPTDFSASATSYAITLSGGSAANYDIALNNGTLTVTPCEAAIEQGGGTSYVTSLSEVVNAAQDNATVAVTLTTSEPVVVNEMAAGKTLTVTPADGVTAHVTVTPADGAFIETTTSGSTTTYESKKITVEMATPQATVEVTKIDHGTESEVTDTAEISAAIAKLENNRDVPRTDNTDKLDVLDKITVTPTKIVEEVVGGNTIIRSATFDVVPTLNAGQSLGAGQKLKFRLPVDAAATQLSAIVYHDGAQFGIFAVQTYNNEKFVEVESDTFSPYGYELLDGETANPVAAIGTTGYATLEAAISAAQGGDTVTLLADVEIKDTTTDQNAGTIAVNKSITIDGGNHTVKVIDDGKSKGHAFTLTVQDQNTGAYASGDLTITIKNLVVDGNNVAKHGINVYGAADHAITVNLDNVETKNNRCFGLNVNSAVVNANDLKASGNGWGKSVGIDPKSQDASLAITGENTNLADTYSVDMDNSSSGGANAGTVTISTGNFTQLLQSSPNNTDFAVSGGTFTSAVPEAFCAEGFIPAAQDPVTGLYSVKTGSYVAQIGTTKYESLAEAVAAASAGDTITMLADDNVSLTDGSRLTIDKSLTITGPVDTNGEPLYTIYGKPTVTGSNNIYIDGSGTVTLSNLKIEGFGNDKNTDGSHAPVYVASSFTGTANLDNLYISDFNRGGVFLYGGTFNVTDCYIDCANSRSGAFTKGIEIKGTATGTIADTLICNMERSGNDAPAGIEIYGKGSILVDDCTIISDVDDHASVKATYGIVSSRVGEHDPSGGSLHVTDCYIDVSNGALSVADSDEYGPVNNYSIVVDGEDTYFGNYIATWSATSSITVNEGEFSEDVYADAGTITITDGTFNNFAPYAGTDGTIAISGGIFDHEVPEEHCAEGYIPATYDAASGLYTVKQGTFVAAVYDDSFELVGKYETLYDAVRAAQDGYTVELLADVEESVTINKSIALTTGDYTITGVTKVNAGATVTMEDVTLDGNGMIYALDIAGGATVDMSGVTVGGGVWCNVHVNGGTLTGEGVTMQGDDLVVAADGQTFTYHGETLDASEAPWGLDVTKIPGKTLKVPFMDIVRESGTDVVELDDMQDKPLVQAGSILYVANMPGDTTLTGVTLPARFGSYSLTIDAGIAFLGDADTPTTGWTIGDWNEVIDTGSTVLDAIGEDSDDVPVELTLNGDADLGDNVFEFRYRNLTIDGANHAVSGTIKYTDYAGVVENIVLGTEEKPLTLDMTEVTDTIHLGNGVDVANVVVQLTTEQATAGTPVFTWTAGDGTTAPAHEEVVIQVAGSASDSALVWDNELGVAYIGPCEARLTGPAHEEPVYTSLAHAIELAANSGDTVTLLMDIENFTGTQIIGKSLTLDGAGHKIVADADASGEEMFDVAGDVEVTIKNVTVDGAHKYTYCIQAFGEADLTLQDVTVLHGTKEWFSGFKYGAGVHVNGATLQLKGNFTAFSGGKTDASFPFTGILYEGGAVLFADGATASIANPEGATDTDLLLVGMLGALDVSDPADRADVEAMLDAMNVPAGFYPYTLKINPDEWNDSFEQNTSFTGASPLGWNDIIDYGKAIMGAISMDTAETPVEVGLLTDTILPDTFTFEDANFTVNGNDYALSGTIEYTDNAGLLENLVMGTDDNALVLDMTGVTQPIEIGSGIVVDNVTVKLTEDQATAGTPVIIWDAAHGVDAPENEAGVTVHLVDGQGADTGETAELIWDDEMGMAYIGPAEARLTGPTHETPIYTTLANAIAWAAQSGDTVTLLTNVSNVTGTITIDKSLTLDGGSNTISAAAVPADGHRNMVDAFMGGTSMLKIEGDVTLRNITLDGDATHRYTYLVSADNSSAKLTTSNVRLLNGGELAGDANGAILEQGAGYGAGIHLNNGAQLVVSNGFYACTGGPDDGVFPFTGILPEGGSSVSFELTGNPNDPANVDIGSDLLLVGMVGVIPLDQVQGVLDYMKVPSRFIPYTLTLGDGSAYAFTGASPRTWNDIIDYGKEIMDVSTAIGYQGLDKVSTPVEVGLLTDTVLPDTFVFEDSNFTVNGNGNALAGTIEYTDNAGQIHDIVMGTEGNALVLDMTDTTKPIVIGSGITVSNVTVQMTAEQATAGTPVIIWDAAHGVDAPENEAGVTVQIVDDHGDSTGVTKELIWDDEMGMAYIGPCEARLTGPTHDKPVYTTLAHAIELAAQTNDTVTLLMNVTNVTTTYEISKQDLVIDGAGYTVAAAPVTEHRNMFEAWSGSKNMFKLQTGNITFRNITLDGDETHAYTFLISADNSSVALTTENVRLIHGGEISEDSNNATVTPGNGYGAAIHLNNGAQLVVSNGFYACTGTNVNGVTTGVFPFTAILPENLEAGTSVAFELTGDPNDPANVDIGDDLLLVGMIGDLIDQYGIDAVQDILDYMKVPSRFIPYTLTLADGSAYAFTGASPRRWNEIIDYGKDIMDVATANGFSGLDKDTTPVEVGLATDTVLPAGADGDGYDFLYEDSNFSINGNGNALSGTIKFTDDANGGLMHDIDLGTDDAPLTLDLSATTNAVMLGGDVVISNVVVKLTEDQATLGKIVFEWDSGETPPDDEQGVEVTVVNNSGTPTGETKGLIWDEEYGVAYIGPCEARLTGSTHETPVYTSLANALDIAKDNDKVELLTNAVLSAVQGVGSDVTLDLAGYKVSVNGAKGLLVTNATLVIADTSVKTNGTICAGDEASPASLIESGNGGVVNIPTGIFVAASGQNVLVTSDNGAIAVSGGYFSNPVLSEHCAESYMPVDAEAGAPQPYTVAEFVNEFRYPIDGSVGVPVERTWLATYMSDIYNDPTKPVLANVTNALVQALSENGANDMPRWESYVLGLNPTDVTARLRLTATSKDAATVTITGLIDMTKFPKPEGTTITFHLAEVNSDGTKKEYLVTDSEEPSFDVLLENVAGKELAIFAGIAVEAVAK